MAWLAAVVELIKRCASDLSGADVLAKGEAIGKGKALNAWGACLAGTCTPDARVMAAVIAAGTAALRAALTKPATGGVGGGDEDVPPMATRLAATGCGAHVGCAEVTGAAAAVGHGV